MKPVKTKVKLQIPAGRANPAPPVGPVLGQHGVGLQDFCNQFNERTKELGNDIIPVEITIYEDRTFDFITKTPPTAGLIKKALRLGKGSSEPHKNKVGELTAKQVEEIAKIKMPDINANDLEAAKKIIAGTARSMGITVKSSK